MVETVPATLGDKIDVRKKFGERDASAPESSQIYPLPHRSSDRQEDTQVQEWLHVQKATCIERATSDCRKDAGSATVSHTFMSFSTTLPTAPGEVVMYHRLPADIDVGLWFDENFRDASAAASPLAGVSLEDEGSKTFVRITLQ